MFKLGKFLEKSAIESVQLAEQILAHLFTQYAPQTIFATRWQHTTIIFGISLLSIKVSIRQKRRSGKPKCKNCKCSHKISNKNVN